MIWIETDPATVPKRPPIVKAPFQKASHALGALGLFLALTLGPAIVDLLAPAPAASVYRGVDATYGNFYTIGSEIAKPGDIDVLILGASDAWTALDPRIIKAELEAEFGRPMRVLNLSSNWPGLDRDYAIVRDILEDRSVKLVLIPETDAAQTNPHELAKFFSRPSAMPPGLDDQAAARSYMMSVVGFPRQLWARFQTPETAPLAGSYLNNAATQEQLLGFNAAKTGWKSHTEADESKRRPYQDIAAPAPASAPADLVYSGAPSAFFEARADYNALQATYILAIRDAVRAAGGTFATFSIPTHFVSTPLEKAWIRNLPGTERDWPVIGIAMTRLFPGMDFEQMKAFYTNESHLNEAGAKAYTSAVMPAIKDLYADATDR